jgi:hypothetical protein
MLRLTPILAGLSWAGDENIPGAVLDHASRAVNRCWLVLVHRRAGPDVGVLRVGMKQIRKIGRKILVPLRRHRLIVVLDIHHQGIAELLVIAEAGCLSGFRTCLGKDRKKDSGEDRNYGDDYESSMSVNPLVWLAKTLLFLRWREVMIAEEFGPITVRSMITP